MTTANQKIIDRIDQVIRTRHDQGITDEQMIAVSGLTPERFEHIRTHGLKGGIASGELAEFCEGIFANELTILTGEVQIRYSACSLRRLMEAHYSRASRGGKHSTTDL